MFNLFDINIISAYYIYVIKNENYLKQFGTTIRNTRIAQGLTSEALANSVNVSRATLWSIESGSGNASLRTYLDIAQILNLKLSILPSTQEITNKRRSPKRITEERVKRNQFEVFCVEKYSQHIHNYSSFVYQLFKKEKILELLRSDYEDLHGMGTEYLMRFFDNYLGKQT